MADYLGEAQGLIEYTRSLRRDFHRHPELGFKEVRTAGIVARELNNLDLKVTTGVAQTGVIGLLAGNKPGPVLLIRFDMDALPIQEETGVDYASEQPGVMHACGHDGHTAIGLTVARLLHAHRDELAGTLKFVFQPAEEGLGGAEGMIRAGVLENPRPELTLGLHLWNERPLGWIGVASGPVMAAADIFTIKIVGKGGHGAQPHTTRDPVLASAQVVTSLQSIVSRNIPPLETAVVSVTMLKAGDAFNIIPSTVEMKGTIRTFQTPIRELVIERFRKLIEGVTEAFGCSAEVDVQSLTPAVINDERVTSAVQKIAGQLMPNDEIETSFCTMGSEDMAFMMQDIPGCYFFIGSANSSIGLDAGHHNPHFNFDEAVLPRAASLMAAAAVRLLNGA